MLEGMTGLIITALIVSVLIGMVVHETMHALVGYALGDDTAAAEGRISLNPLRHIDPFYTIILPIITVLIFKVPILAAKPVPFNPARVKFDEFGSAMIALAGPLSNFVLSIIGALFMHFTSVGSVAYNSLSVFVAVNVALFVFNLVPIPPLDGSRVLFAFAPRWLQGIMASLEQFGLIIVFGLVLIGGFSFLGNLMNTVVNFVLSITGVA